MAWRSRHWELRAVSYPSDRVGVCWCKYDVLDGGCRHGRRRGVVLFEMLLRDCRSRSDGGGFGRVATFDVPTARALTQGVHGVASHDREHRT